MFSSESYMEVKLHFIDLFVLLKIQTFIHFYIFLKVHYVTFGPVAANKKQKTSQKNMHFTGEHCFGCASGLLDCDTHEHFQHEN